MITRKTGDAIVITLALSKGRIFDETLPLLAAAGITVTEDPETSRKLILPPTARCARGAGARHRRAHLRRIRRRRPGRDRARTC
jgi:hypothetical protein